MHRACSLTADDTPMKLTRNLRGELDSDDRYVESEVQRLASRGRQWLLGGFGVHQQLSM